MGVEREGSVAGAGSVAPEAEQQAGEGAAEVAEGGSTGWRAGSGAAPAETEALMSYLKERRKSREDWTALIPRAAGAESCQLGVGLGSEGTRLWPGDSGRRPALGSDPPRWVSEGSEQALEA